YIPGCIYMHPLFSDLDAGTRKAHRSCFKRRGRLHEVVWIKPLWIRLIKASTRLQHKPDEYVNRKCEQLDAALLVLNSQRDQDTSNVGSTNSTHHAPIPATLQAVVIRGVIPRSSERSENDYLKAYEALSRPV